MIDFPADFSMKCQEGRYRLVSSHQQSWHIHLRSRQAGSAPEWQVWCHANCCFTEDSVTCPWMTYLWHTQCRIYCQKVLIFTSSACFKLMSYWSSLLRLLEVIFSYETLCNLYNPFLLLLHWEYGQQAKKKKNDAIKHFILSLVNESQISRGVSHLLWTHQGLLSWLGMSKCALISGMSMQELAVHQIYLLSGSNIKLFLLII